MANLRLIYDNASDRATLSASSTSGTLAAANVQINEKAAVWRSTGTTATLTATWTTAEAVDSVALGWTNLTPLATVTAKLYTNAADTVPVATLAVNPDTALPLGQFVWGVDALVQGGAQAARVAAQTQLWFTTGQAVKKLEIVIDDPLNPLGYVEVSRLSVGLRYEMALDPQLGSKLRIVDRSKAARAESGDVRVEPAGQYRALELDFAYLEIADVTFLTKLASYGKTNSIFVSLYPDTTDVLHQMTAFFAYVSGNYESTFVVYSAWNNALTLEEIA